MSSRSDGRYGACKVENLCHVQTKETEILSLNESQRDAIRERFFQELPDSALAKHSIGRKCLVAKAVQSSADNIAPHWSILKVIEHCMDCNKYLPNISDHLMPIQDSMYYRENIYKNKREIENICHLTMEQNNDLWKKERSIRVTGSVCYELYTYGRRKNADWEKKLTNIFRSKFKGNENTEYGKKWEKTALTLYGTLYGCDVKQFGLIISPLLTCFAFSPDGIVFNDEKPIKLLEVKCPKIGAEKSAEEMVQFLKYIVHDGHGNYSLKKNHKYYGQVQLGLAILNLNSCDFVIFSSKDQTLKTLEVLADYSFIYKLTEKLLNDFTKIIFPYLCSHNS
ncbi:uncharacterized protein [Centruroides vittatus]|uniref:uncharacterized protein n=1 Tax=Centruroides vittatus TaxID=120091 RepID=UPI00350F4498